MSEFEDKLNAILSNPDAMAQVMQLAQSLGGTAPSQEAPQPDTERPPPEPPKDTGGGSRPMGDFARIGELFSGLDPKLMGRLVPLLGELTQNDSDERLQLLYALRPFLKPERQDKVERAIKAARLIHLGRKFLTAMGEQDV